MNDITLFFRKMIIIFMLFIVSFSVLLAILKPKSTNTTASKEENTHLEKMLYNKKSTSDTQKSTQNVDFTTDNHFEKELKIEQKKVEETPPIDDVQINNIKRESNHAKRPTLDTPKEIKSYTTIQKELSEKYNNDPNAEVSEEDILKYMNKVIESLPQQ